MQKSNLPQANCFSTMERVNFYVRFFHQNWRKNWRKPIYVLLWNIIYVVFLSWHLFRNVLHVLYTLNNLSPVSTKHFHISACFLLRLWIRVIVMTTFILLIHHGSLLPVVIKLFSIFVRNAMIENIEKIHFIVHAS